MTTVGTKSLSQLLSSCQKEGRVSTVSGLEAWPDLPTTTSCSGRTRQPSRRLAESATPFDFHGEKRYYVASLAQVPSPDQAHDQHLGLQERMCDPIATHAEIKGNSTYYHQAIKQDDDAGEF